MPSRIKKKLYPSDRYGGNVIRSRFSRGPSSTVHFLYNHASTSTVIVCLPPAVTHPVNQQVQLQIMGFWPTTFLHLAGCFTLAPCGGTQSALCIRPPQERNGLCYCMRKRPRCRADRLGFSNLLMALWAKHLFVFSRAVCGRVADEIRVNTGEKKQATAVSWAAPDYLPQQIHIKHVTAASQIQI